MFVSCIKTQVKVRFWKKTYFSDVHLTPMHFARVKQICGSRYWMRRRNVFLHKTIFAPWIWIHTLYVGEVTGAPLFTPCCFAIPS